MINLVCFLEEPSAAEMLKGIVPRLYPTEVNLIPIPFEGKQDLEKQLERKIRNWQMPDSVFLVMRDQDAGDCVAIKTGLADKVQRVGKADQTLVRIACRELESFYIGDLQAVEKGLDVSGLTALSAKAKYRNPDALGNPADELMKITKGIYQKVSGSRAIAPHLDFDRNASHSFNVLVSGLRRLVENSGFRALEQ